MRKIITALMGTVSGLVLLFSYHTSTASQVLSAATTATDGGSATESGSSPDTSSDGAASDGADWADTSSDIGSTDGASSDSASSGGSSSADTTAVSGTFTGDAVGTRYGNVQVEITVEDGIITSATAIDYPTRDRHDQQINSYAVPVLNAEAVDAQSADIDSVSGATFTSVGYIQSLQSAIDQAFQ